MLEVASYQRTYSVHEHCWHINGEHEEGHERLVPLLVFDAIELSEQTQVPLLNERVEPHSILRHVDA